MPIEQGSYTEDETWSTPENSSKDHPIPQKRLSTTILERPVKTREHELRAVIESEFDKTSATRELLTKHVPDAVSAKLNPDQVRNLITTVEQEFERDPQTKDLYERILIEGDRETLKEKTRQQVTRLRNLYYGPRPLLRPRESWKKHKHLNSFRSFVEQLRPVRQDRNLFDRYESPRNTGMISSYGAQDLVAQADNYVYASFDNIRHNMTRGNEHIRAFNEAEATERSEIVMQDIANIQARYPETFVAAYVNNLFDYEGGKELLATYLAHVFESIDEATRYLEHNNDPHTAQRWNDFLEEGPVREHMLEIHQALGIEPPLSLEVRIKDHANIA